MGTLFASVYNRFLGKITDDMYMELTPQETIDDLQNLLIDAIPGFEFPRKSLEYTILEKPIDGVKEGYIIGDIKDVSAFDAELDGEEINILAILMLNSWLQRQITTVENIRMKYSGADFKMTSQANHLGKLLNLQTETQRQSKYLQRLYKRRRLNPNTKVYESNWSVFMEDSVIGGIKPPITPSTNNQDEEEWIEFGEGGTI